MFLTKQKILELYHENSIIVRPLLREDQFGEISLDLRLGGDFLVSQQGRDIFIDATGDDTQRPVSSFFLETRKQIGDAFYLYPHQTVLCSTLEYVKLPDNIFLSLTTRSSYNRLGLVVSSIIQPGYCGCLPIELTNNNNTPIKLLVGASLVQVRFNQLTEDTNYYQKQRKYTCQVRPVSSRVSDDVDFEMLKKMAKE